VISKIISTKAGKGRGGCKRRDTKKKRAVSGGKSGILESGPRSNRNAKCSKGEERKKERKKPKKGHVCIDAMNQSTRAKIIQQMMGLHD